jgi:DNA invertase Pin-like site-specific DNA recombinase
MKTGDFSSGKDSAGNCCQDTQSQEPDLKRWAETHGGEVRWYRDTFTGTSMDRPGLSRLLQAIASGLVSDVVVGRLDRLGRTAKGLTALFDDLIQRKVNLRVP